MFKFFFFFFIKKPFKFVPKNYNNTKSFLLKLKEIKISDFKHPEAIEPMMDILNQLDSNYSEYESNYLQELVRCQKLIIAYTRKNEDEEVKELIDLAKEILNRLKKDSRKLGCVFLYPSFAFYYYKLGNKKTAKRYISLTIKHDDYLTPKYPTLHLHKLHHILNLNKIFIKQNDLNLSEDLFITLLNYLYFFKLNPKYGNGGKSFFDNVSSGHGLHSFSGIFLNEYFLTVWKNPMLEKRILNNNELVSFLDAKTEDKNLSCLQDYWFIQNTFELKSESFDLILSFFKKYNFYLFDPFRLLILRKLYSMVKENDKEIITDIINSNLNFKFPELLVDRIVNTNLDL
jgi:hypothetical protein